MADIAPITSRPTSGVSVYTWENVTASDTAVAVLPGGTTPIIASLQSDATATVQVSNDGTTWSDLNDAAGDPVSVTGSGQVDFSTGAVYIRPSGPSTYTAILSLRG